MVNLFGGMYIGVVRMRLEVGTHGVNDTMTRTVSRWTPALASLLGLFSLVAAPSGQVFVGTPVPPQFSAQGQPSVKNGEWPHYTADIKGTRYSPLDQINAPTSTSWKSPGASRPTTSARVPEFKLEGTPLMVKGVLYTTAGTRRSVIALDAKTGELIWAHSLREGQARAVAPRQLSGRGLSYWTDGKATNASSM